jgi:subtilisin family serine protease
LTNGPGFVNDPARRTGIAQLEKGENMSTRDFRARGGAVAIMLVALVTVVITAAGASANSHAGAASADFTATPLTPDNTFTGAKSSSGSIAETDPALLGRLDATPVNVMVKYDFDATASYQGGVNGLAATSPGKTGKKLKDNKPAVAAYEQYTAGLIDKTDAAATAAVPDMVIRSSYKTVYGGVAAVLPANQVGTLLTVPGVVAVQSDSLNQPLDDNTQFIGATAVWPSLGGSSSAGSNVVVGVIDSGVWAEHPMLSAAGVSAPPGGLRGCSDFATGGDVAHLGPAFSCNNKLIGAYAKTATYMVAHGSDGQEFCNDATDVCSPRDSEGHGTHTMTTAAGDCVNSAILYGVQRGPVCGIAPGAHVIAYRVCLSAGCFSSDSVSAVQQAITDGVDVINFSISGGANPYSDPVELAFLDATNAGISVNASAGNSGPGASTSDHGGPWVTTVGASTGPRSFVSTLHLTADGGATLDVPGVTLTNGISSPTPVVLANTLPGEDAACQSTLAAGTATGKVVVCARGGNGRIDKGRRVLAGGAVGMILYNQNAATTDLESDNHYLPAIQTQFNSNSIATFVSGHTNVMATWAQGTATPSQADVMASFSSRGPTGDWIKPDITAPGVQVLAGTTPQPDQTTADNGPPGNFYMAIAGTSMSSPHSAGVSALVKAAHPTWTPEMIKSALMTSSLQGVVKEDGVTPAGVFDMGAGSIRANRAVNPSVVFNETYADFVAAGSDTLHRIDLNIASIDATTMSGFIATERTAINVSGSTLKLAVNITEPPGVDIVVGNKNHDLSLSPSGSLTFPITISAPDVANGQYQARINLTPKGGGTNVTIPVAFRKTQGQVSLTHTCSPTSFPLNTGVSHCTVTAQNLGSVASNADLSVAQRENGKHLIYQNVGAPGTVVGSGVGVRWAGSLSPALPPSVTSITPGGSPAGGYLPLAPFGVPPIAGVGDDTITNFNVPTFFYGAEPYTRLGVVSNGYLVLGGGTSSDIVFTPQHFPNPARPNNVVAPLWTDLNPPAGGTIRIGTLTDGSNTWIVVDWAGVKNFGNATTHQFEVWLRVASGAAGTGPSSEQVTWAYGTGNAGSGDPDSGQNWGAENRDGSSGANIASAPANGSDWTVNTSPPVAGGSVTIPFDVSGDKTGTYTSDAELTSSTTPGTTIAPQVLTVTP